MKTLGAVLAFVALTAMLPAPRAPLWSAAVDSRTADQWIAEAPGTIYALRDGRPVALDAATGLARWTSSLQAAGAPALAGRALAVPVTHGAVWIDARTGRPIARRSFLETPLLVGSASDIVAVFRSGTVEGFSGEGRLRWRRSLGPIYESDAERLGADGVLIFGIGRHTGALVLDASNGHAVGYATDVNELVGDDGRYLWFTVVAGGIKGLDLQTARSVAVHGAVIAGAVSVEHAIAIAVINGRLDEIDLNDGGAPKHLAIDGRWVGGPLDGKIFVERSDGLYVQALAPASRPVKIASYASHVRYIGDDRSVAYVGLRDGTLFAVDLRSDAIVESVATGCSFYEGFSATGKTAFVHCDRGNVSHLVAFPRVGF